MKRFVCIDPGHGGSDPGACYGADQEKYFVLEIAGKIRTELLRQGFKVCMTRRIDTYHTPAQKARIANNSGAEAFLSIHCNAAENMAACGTETLSYGLTGDGFRLAEAVQKEVVAACGTADRGVKERKDLAVLNTTKMPAVLLEAAFISNAEDRKRLRDAVWQRTLARAVCKGICNYFKVAYQEEEGKGDADMEKQYHTLEELPDWARPTVEKLLKKGYLKGGDSGLGLSETAVKVFVVNDRAGLYQ